MLVAFLLLRGALATSPAGLLRQPLAVVTLVVGPLELRSAIAALPGLRLLILLLLVVVLPVHLPARLLVTLAAAVSLIGLEPVGPLPAAVFPLAAPPALPAAPLLTVGAGPLLPAADALL